jgi:hypothetical protein
MRNLQSKMPEDVWPEFKARVAACYQAASRVLARLLRDDIAVTYGKDLPTAVACLDDDFEACIAHRRFPLGHRRVIRTTNLLERLFGEARRRTKVIPHAFGERAVLKLVYAALIRAAEHWRGIRITEFEQRQLRQYATKSTRISPRAIPQLSAQRSPQPQPVSPAMTGLDRRRGRPSTDEGDVGVSSTDPRRERASPLRSERRRGREHASRSAHCRGVARDSR